MNSTGGIEYKDAEGNVHKALGVTELRYDMKIGQPVGKYRMFLSNKAFSSREQLSTIMQHKLNHVRITNAGFGIDAATEVYGMDDLIYKVGHYHIQDSQTKFMINNG